MSTYIEEEVKQNMLIQKTAETVFDVLRKNGFEIKEKKSTFQRTEQLLYLVPQLKKAINHNKERIKDLEENGITKKQSAVHIVPTSTPIKQDEEEIIQKEISKIRQRNKVIDSNIKWINGILNTLAKDKYYDLIRLKYYENKTHEEIAEYFDCDESTIRRNKNKIINKLRGLLFPNDSIDELGY